MRLDMFLKNKGIYVLRYIISVTVSPLYVLAVGQGVLNGKLAFLQPLIVGTMPLALQIISADTVFSLVRTQGYNDRKLSVMIFIAALLFCQIAVRAGWFVFETVLISAITVLVSPSGFIHFALRWSLLVLFLILGLS